MKITSIELFPVTIPLKETIRWSFGTRASTTKLYIKIKTEDGLTGWGEGSGPVAASTLVAQINASTRDLVIGENPFDVERIIKKCQGSGLRWVMEFGVFVISGIELALYDLMGKYAGVPVARLLGGIYRKEVTYGGYVFIDTAEQMATKALAYKEAGYKAIKLKGGINVNEDIANVAAVRKAIGSDIALRLDPNQVWAPGTAVQTLTALEPYNLQYVEQPVRREDFRQSRNVRIRSRVPIAVNESIYTPEDALRVVTEEAADVIVADVHNAGGLLGCKKVCAIAEAAGLPVVLHSGAEMGIGLMAMTHMAASSPCFIYPNDTHYDYLADDILSSKLDMPGGRITLSDAPGFGVEVDEAKLRKYAMKEDTTPFLDEQNDAWLPQAPGL